MSCWPASSDPSSSELLARFELLFFSAGGDVPESTRHDAPAPASRIDVGAEPLPPEASPRPRDPALPISNKISFHAKHTHTHLPHYLSFQDSLLWKLVEADGSAMERAMEVVWKLMESCVKVKTSSNRGCYGIARPKIPSTGI